MSHRWTSQWKDRYRHWSGCHDQCLLLYDIDPLSDRYHCCLLLIDGRRQWRESSLRHNGEVTASHENVPQDRRRRSLEARRRCPFDRCLRSEGVPSQTREWTRSVLVIPSRSISSSVREKLRPPSHLWPSRDWCLCERAEGKEDHGEVRRAYLPWSLTFYPLFYPLNSTICTLPRNPRLS